MKRLLLVLAFIFVPGVLAQDAATWQFRWQKGQVLSYQVEHNTSVAEVVEGNKVQSQSKLKILKRWQVADVDAKGNATLNLTLAAMRQEQTRPNGEVLLFDSADLEKSNPELREALGKYVGKTLAIVRLDAQGRVLEVKQGSAARYDAEPPLVAVFPAAAVQQGQGWLRPFTIVLEPPQGTGEKHQAVQRYECIKIEGGRATLSVTTQLKNPPETKQEQIPLLQKLPEGQVVFDLQAGRLLSAQFTIDKSLENHQGKGSSYQFQSNYVERFVSAE